MMRNMTYIPTKTVRLAAAHAQVDEKTLRRVIAGAPTRQATRERALDGLRAVGVDEVDIAGMLLKAVPKEMTR
jgi:hypothetical protein